MKEEIDKSKNKKRNSTELRFLYENVTNWHTTVNKLTPDHANAFLPRLQDKIKIKSKTLGLRRSLDLSRLAI